MEKKRMKQVWDALVESYRQTVEYTSHGTTGDPRRTVDAVAEKGVSYEELAGVLAVIAKIKEHDGRIGRRNREWLYGYLTADSDDWYDEYGDAIGTPDAIHPAHLDNLISCLRTKTAQKEGGPA